MSDQDLNAPVQLPQNIDGVNIHLSYIRRDLESINKKIDTLGVSFVSHEEFITYKDTVHSDFVKLADKKEVDNVANRLNELEGNQKWIVRTIIGVVILAVLSLVVVSKI